MAPVFLFFNFNGGSLKFHHVPVAEFFSSLGFHLAVDLHQTVLNGKLGVYAGFHQIGGLQRLAQFNVLVSSLITSMVETAPFTVYLYIYALFCLPAAHTFSLF